MNEVPDAQKTKQNMKTINGPELKQQIDSGKTLIVEGLPEQYYRSGHIPGALNLPFDNMEELASTVLPDRSAPVVVYCGSSSCKTLPIAVERLTVLGYKNVTVYLGGKADWKKLGFPLMPGENPK